MDLTIKLAVHDSSILYGNFSSGIYSTEKKLKDIK